MTNRYNRAAVEDQIKRDPRIKGREARMIHALLKGRQRDDGEGIGGQVDIELPPYVKRS